MALTSLYRTLAALVIAGFCVVPAPLLFAAAVPGLAISPVLADDDDDGGDDDGGDDDTDNGGDDSGGSYDDWPVFSPPQGPRRQPAPVVALPVMAPDEVVAYGLTTTDLARLLEAGYILRADEDLADLGLLVRLQVPVGQSVANALEQISLLAPDAIAAPNSYYYNQSEPVSCDAAICDLWPLVGWPDAGADQCTAAPLIGVVDTGVNVDHDVFKGADVVVERFIDEADAPSEAKHGTAVVAMLAGAATSRVPGLLPRARIRVADPFAGLDGGDRADTYALTRAIVHLFTLQVDVINLSLAGADNAVLAGVVALAETKGIPLIAAVGNAGANSPPLYPAAYASVLAVTAVDTRMRIYRRAVQGSHVDLAAPGVSIPTAASIAGVRPQTGTSFAVPFVTAALAVKLSTEPALTPAAAVQMLVADANDLGEAGRDNTFGWGLVQLEGPCSN